MENQRDRIKEQGKTEEWPEQVREEHRRLAHQSAESFWQELEQDFRKAVINIINSFDFNFHSDHCFG